MVYAEARRGDGKPSVAKARDRGPGKISVHSAAAHNNVRFAYFFDLHTEAPPNGSSYTEIISYLPKKCNMKVVVYKHNEFG